MTTQERLESFVQAYNDLVQKYGITFQGYIVTKSKTKPSKPEDEITFVSVEPAFVTDWKEPIADSSV